MHVLYFFRDKNDKEDCKGVTNYNGVPPSAGDIIYRNETAYLPDGKLTQYGSRDKKFKVIRIDRCIRFSPIGREVHTLWSPDRTDRWEVINEVLDKEQKVIHDLNAHGIIATHEEAQVTCELITDEN